MRKQDFALLSPARHLDRVRELSYEEAYNTPLQNLNNYSIIRPGKPKKIDFHLLYTTSKKTVYTEHDNDPFSQFVMLYKESNTDSKAVKVVASAVDEFINGFLLYCELLCRYSKTKLHYPSFEIIDLETKDLNTTRPLSGSLRSIMQDWLFNLLPSELQKEITDYIPLNFMRVSKKYYNMYAVKLSMKTRCSLKTLQGEIRRRCICKYPLSRIIELLGRNHRRKMAPLVLGEAVYNLEFFSYLLHRYYRISINEDNIVDVLVQTQQNINEGRVVVLKQEDIRNLIIDLLNNSRYSFRAKHVVSLFARSDIIYNSELFSFLLKKYYGTLIDEGDIINVLVQAQQKINTKNDEDSKQKVSDLIMKLLNNSKYSFSDIHITRLFASSVKSLSTMLFDTGRVYPSLLNICISELTESYKNLSLGALEILVNNSSYDISECADKLIPQLQERELLDQLLHDPRVTSDHIYRVLLRYADNTFWDIIPTLVSKVWYKVYSNPKSVRLLGEKFPQIILPVLESEGLLIDESYTETFVTPYINETIILHIEKFCEKHPNIVKYLLRVQKVDPSYNYNIIARTLIKYNHIDALRELIADSRTKLGPGTRKAILENPLLRHLLGDSPK
jgi:hypothetical protein